MGSNGLGESLRRSASALSSANNTIEQSVGLITAIDEIIQDPEVSGTALKTISMRLRSSAGQLQELGEDAEGAAESVTKLQQQIKQLSGVDIMLSPDQFKSTYDIIVELSKVWQNLSDLQQADLTRLIAGNLVKRPRYVEIHTISTNLNPVMPKALLLQRAMKQAA